MAREPGTPFSHSEHMAVMFFLYVKTLPIRQLLSRPVTMEDLQMVFNAGYVEGMWSERTHPGVPVRQRAPAAKRSR